MLILMSVIKKSYKGNKNEHVMKQDPLCLMSDRVSINSVVC